MTGNYFFSEVSMKNLLPIIFFLPLGSCMVHPPGRTIGYNGPFIDSIGYHAAQARLEIVDREASNALISQALSVPEDTHHLPRQPEFFQSIEESYQRYLKLFSPVRRAPRPEVRCKFDLIETFRLLIFDPQPFLNAILHTMSLTAVSTLDFTVQPKNADTTLVHVALTKAIPQEGTRWVTFSEGELALSVTRHSAALLSPKP